jgi:hypothetical protein
MHVCVCIYCRGNSQPCKSVRRYLLKAIIFLQYSVKCNWCYVTWVAVARVAADPVTSGVESFAMLAVFGAPVTSTTHTKTPTWAASLAIAISALKGRRLFSQRRASTLSSVRALTQIFTPGRDSKSLNALHKAHTLHSDALNEESFFSRDETRGDTFLWKRQRASP